MKNTKPRQPLELIGAKVSPDIKAVIEKKAAEEERSVSQSISRLLASHPEVKRMLKQVKAGRAGVGVS